MNAAKYRKMQSWKTVFKIVLTLKSSETANITISYVSTQKNFDTDFEFEPRNILRTFLKFRKSSASTFL